MSMKLQIDTKTSDPQEELLTQVDENNSVIGSISRGKAHNIVGVFYRTIYVLVFNDQGEVLIQKRSPSKDLYPNRWDLSVGGHVNFGKNYLETAIREVKEELGFKVDKTNLIFKGEVLVKLSKAGEFFSVFEYKLNPDQVISANIEEVDETKWMTIVDIKKSMANKLLDWYDRPLQVIRALY